jgi:hypothetical protein
VPDDPLIVRRDRDVRALAETTLHELDVRAIDVPLLGVRDRRGLEVGPFHDAKVRRAWEELLEIVGGAVEVRLQHSADAVVTGIAKALVDAEREVDVVRLLHVDPDERPQRAGTRDQPLDVRVRDLLVEP